jgi:hypothetical protein
MNQWLKEALSEACDCNGGAGKGSIRRGVLALVFLAAIARGFLAMWFDLSASELSFWIPLMTLAAGLVGVGRFAEQRSEA